MKYLFSFLIAFLTLSLAAQVDDELGFIYVKADYLLETERFKDAAVEFDKVVKKDPSYKDALLKRAASYLGLGSYDLAETSVLDAFHFNGVSHEGIKILGMAQGGQRNYEAAQQTLELALQINYKDAELHLAMGELHLGQENFDDACESWRVAEKLGSDKARLQSMKYCKDQPTTEKSPKKKKGNGKIGNTKMKLPKGKIPTKTGKNDQEDESDPVIVQRPDTNEEPEEEEEVIEIDDTVREKEIDESLTLVFKDGIGSREVLQQPDIFIMSSETGNVAVEVCINARGKVERAEIMKGASSINSTSLTSLALRKAKEFWFAKGDQKEMCGTIDFKFIGM